MTQSTTRETTTSKSPTAVAKPDPKGEAKPDPKAAAVVELPLTIKWAETHMVRTGGFQTKPVPEWALAAVNQSYQRTKSGADTPALTSELASEAQAKMVLTQLRRAAKQQGYGLRGTVQGAVLTFQATDPIKGKNAANGTAAGAPATVGAPVPSA